MPEQASRPKLPKISEEMKAWSAALAGEVGEWPHVSTRSFFGFTALYRKDKMFAALPRCRVRVGGIRRTLSRSSWTIQLPALGRGLRRTHALGPAWARMGVGSLLNSHPTRTCTAPSTGWDGRMRRRAGRRNHPSGSPLVIGITSEYTDFERTFERYISRYGKSLGRKSTFRATASRRFLCRHASAGPARSSIAI